MMMHSSPMAIGAQNEHGKQDGQPILLKAGGMSNHHFRDGELIRQRGTTSVYVIERGLRHGIPDPKTFNARDYTSEAIKNISAEEMSSIPKGQPIPSVTLAGTPKNRFHDGELIRQKGGSSIYVIERGLRRGIPDLKTFKVRGYSWGAVKDISIDEMSFIPKGPTIPSVK